MKKRWQNPDKRMARNREAHFKSRTNGLPFRARIDGVLLTGIVLGLVGAALVLFLIFQVADLLGFRERTLIQPLSDARKLENIRDEIADKKLSAVTWHPTDNRLYLAQEGGRVHRYDPRTRLWSSETPFAEGDGITTDLVGLRSGNGVDPDVAEDDAPVLWARSAGDGLAMRGSSGWRTVIGDTRLTDSEGNPVDDSMLTDAAISADGSWLAVGTKGAGVGLYDLERRSWIEPAEVWHDTLSRLMPRATVTRVAFWRDRFWIGGPEGLLSFRPSRAGPVLMDDTILDYAITDLDADPDGGLWVLAEKPCLQDESLCKWMGVLTEPNAIEVLMDERNIFPELDLATLSFAHQSGSVLTLAGDAGIFIYYTGQRRWSKPFDGRILEVLPLESEGGFAFGYVGGFGYCNSGQVDIWSVAGQQVVALSGRSRNELLALTSTGRVYGLNEDRAPVLRFRGVPPGGENQRYTHGLAMDDEILMLGPRAAMIHDTRNRTYRDLNTDTLPAWLRDDQTRLAFAGDAIYGLRRTGNRLQLTSAPKVLIRMGRMDQHVEVLARDLPLETRMRTWDDYGVFLLGGDAGPTRMTPTQILSLVGRAASISSGEPFRDITRVGDRIAVTTDSALLVYDLDDRSWSEPIAHAGDDPLIGLEGADGLLLARTRSGVLKSGTFTKTGLQLETAMGQGRFPFDDDDLSDVRYDEDTERLYMGGNGRLAIYSTILRGVISTHRLSGTGPVEIAGVFKGVPITHNDSRAWFFESPIDPAAGEVLSVSVDETTIWTVRRRAGTTYLKGYPIASPTSAEETPCYFADPAPPFPIERVIDARAISEEMVAVSTPRGLVFYHNAKRSWHRPAETLLPRGGRIHVMTNEMVLAEERADGTTRLTFIPLETIRPPAGCDSGQVQLSSYSRTVTHYAADEASDQLAILEDDGGVTIRRRMKPVKALEPPGGGPDPGSLNRVFARLEGDEKHLWFASGDGLLRYDLELHQWTRIEIRPDEHNFRIDDVTLVHDDGDEQVLVRDEQGGFHLGTYRTDSRSSEVTVSRLLDPTQSRAPIEPSALLDLHGGSDTIWTHVTRDGLTYFDPVARVWLTGPRITSSDPPTCASAPSADVIVGNAGRSWWVTRRYGESPGGYLYTADLARVDRGAGETMAIDENRAIWRLTTEGRLLRATQPATGNYRDFTQAAPDPLTLAPATVRGAYRWGDRVLLDTRSGPRMIDAIDAGEVTLPAAARTSEPIVKALEIEAALLLHAGRDLIWLERSGERLGAMRIEDVTELIADRGGTPWVDRGGTWSRWDGSRFNPLETRTARVFPIHGARISGLTASGVPIVWESGDETRAPSPLPTGIYADEIGWLTAGATKDWWAWTPGGLYHLGERNGALAILGSVDGRGLAEPIQLRPLTTGLEITERDGTITEIRPDRGGYTRSQTTREDTPRFTAVDIWETLQANMVTRADGSGTYDPITALRVDESGTLFAVRPSGPRRLSEGAMLEPVAAGPLDAGWLRWQGDDRSFAIATEAGTTTLPLSRVLIDGHYIFTPVEALSLSNEGVFHAANRHGIWRHGDPSLYLGDPTIRYIPMSLTGPIGAAHGRIYHAGGAYDPELGGLGPEDRAHRVEMGAITLTEPGPEGGVRATIDLGDRRIDAFASQGFVWDRERTGLAFEDGELLLQSGAGLHGADDYRVFDSGPGNGSGPMRRPFTDPQLGVLVLDGDAWYQRTPNGWRRLPTDPRLNRPLIESDAWSWTLRNGRAFVAPVGSEQAYPLERDGFAWDRLRAAAALPTGLYVMSDAFMEARARPDELSRLSALRAPSRETDRFEVRLSAGNDPVLLRHRAGRTSRWDTSRRDFAATDEETLAPIAAIDFLRFRKTGNRIVKEIRLARTNAEPVWVPYRFTDGRFPFDLVTDMAVEDDIAYLGTRVGLQIYRAELPVRTRDVMALLAVGRDETDKAVAVDSISIDPDVPGRVLSRAGNEALVLEPDDRFTWQTAEPVTEKVRLETPLWRWVRDENGQLRGRYRFGSEQGAPVTLSRGRFPHDRITDLVLHEGKAFTLWGNGAVTRFSGALPDLEEVAESWSVGPGYDRFLSVPTPRLQPEGRIEAGLYLRGEDGGFLMLSASGWQPLEAPAGLIASLTRASVRPDIFAARDLRLPRAENGASLRFEARDLDNTWQPIPWSDGRVAIDRWDALIQLQNGLWAATPAGFTRFSRTIEGKIQLNPDRVFVIEDLAKRFPGAKVTDLASSAGNELLVRLDDDSSRVFAGNLVPGGDPLEPNETDVFASRVWITEEATGLWEWRLDGRRDGRSGFLSVSMGEHRPSLVGGRFDFDTLSSLALFDDDWVELGTEAAGWYRLPRPDPVIGRMTRMALGGLDPLSVREVGVSRVADRPHLSLSTFAGEAIRVSASGLVERVERFWEHAASDGMWQYRRMADTLSITSTHTNTGQAQRVLSGGRFTDDRVTGWPLRVRGDDGDRTLIPTDAGLMVTRPDLRAASIRLAPFTGMVGEEVPAVLFDREGPHYIGTDGIYALETGERIADLVLDAPPDSIPTAMTSARGGAWRLSWKSGGEIGWNRLRGKDLAAFPANTRFVDVSGSDTFQKHRLALADPDAWLQVEIDGSLIRAHMEGVPGTLAVSTAADFQLVDAIPVDGRLFLVGRRHIYDLSLDQALADLFAGRGSARSAHLDQPASRLAWGFGPVIQSPVPSRVTEHTGTEQP